jgi:hypothetical protein
MMFAFDRLKWGIVLGLFTLISSLFSSPPNEARGQIPSAAPNQIRSENVPSFHEQWKVFNELGFELTSTSLRTDFEKLANEKLIIERPFAYLYMEMGRGIQREPWSHFTDRVWDFDTEAIEDHGDYIEIMRNLERISRGEIRFESLTDHVDIEEGKAWVAFSIKGRKYKWDLVADDDWVDPQLFSKIAELTRSINTKGRYTYFDTGGQNAVIGFETPESLDAIKKATGLKIEWLD